MKKNIKAIITLFTTAALITTVASASFAKTASAKADNVVLKVGASVVPHSEILNFIKPDLAKEGVDLQVITLDDDGQLNPALQEKQIDANYFQHAPYYESVAKEKGYDFVIAAKVHVEPIGLYSSKIKSIKQLKNGAKIGIPNNPSNEFRALVLLENNGLIKLKKGIADYQATPRDIVSNPKKLKFVEVEAQQLPRVLPDVDAAIINTNLVLEAKIDPKSALLREDAKSPYANDIYVRNGDQNRPEIQKLVKAITSQKVKDFIKKKYGVAVVPAF